MKEGKVFKRILAIALVVVMTITMMPFGVFAEGECAHNTGEHTVIARVEPTCTTDGHYRYYQCKCGVYFNRRDEATEQLSEVIADPTTFGVIPNLGGHTWDDGKVTTAPKCEVKGVKTFECTVEGCDGTKTEEVDALGHDLVNVEKKDPTCTEDGYNAHRACNNAGCNEKEGFEVILAACKFPETLSSINTTTHGIKCTVCSKVKAGSIANHQWGKGVVTNKATCTVDGLRTYTCECGEIKTEAIEAEGHKWSMNGCTVCHITCDHDWSNKDGKCKECETLCSPHNNSDATCVAESACTVCGKVNSGKDATNHGDAETDLKNVKAATCYEEGYTGDEYCSACKKLVKSGKAIEKTAHSFATTITSAGNAKHGKACKNDGCNEFDDLKDHEWTLNREIEKATCTKAGKGYYICNTCNETAEREIEQLGHAFATVVTKKDNDTHGKKCARCDAYDAVANHDWDFKSEKTPATCTVDGVGNYECKDCAATKEDKIEKLGHNTTGVAFEKVDNDKHGKKCKTCNNFVDEVAHDFTTVTATTPATCVATGTQTKKCACGAEKTETLAINPEAHNIEGVLFEKVDAEKHGKKCKLCNVVVAKAAHAYTEDAGSKTPTCTTEGSETKRCVCGDTKTTKLDKNDAHQWGTWNITTNATCTTDGKKERSCTRTSGDVACTHKEEEVIPATGHDLVKVPAVAATCQADGHNEYYDCSKCDAVFKADKTTATTVEAEKIAKGEHSFTTYKYNVGSETCTKEGTETAKCDNCDVTHTRDKVGTMVAHTFKNYVADGNATCIADGTKTAVCEMCKVAKDEVADKDSHKTAPHKPDSTGRKCELCNAELVCTHTYSVEKLITKTPTCTEKGQKAIVCSKCKANKPGSEEELAALGHAWDEGEVITAASCKEEGKMKYKCNNMCGETKEETVAKTDHNYKEVITHATCTEAGYSTFTCTVCGSHYVDNPVKAYDHMFETYFYDEGSATCYQDGTKTAECANGCGTKNTVADPGSKTDHEMTDFTVITPATCTEDGEEEAKCFYHEKCGYSELIPVEALGHDDSGEFVETKAATCTEKGEKQKTCTRCPEIVATEEIPALGHDETAEFVETLAATCTTEGSKEKKCARCSEVIATEAIPALGHDIAADYTIDVPATCTTEGSQSKHCSRCDYKDGVVAIPASGHDMQPGEGTTATCTEPGKAVFVCANGCGKTHEEANVPALGHSFTYTSNGDATCQADGTKTGKCIRCDVTETVADEGSMLEHVFGEPVIDKASTEKGGLVTTKCTNCEYEEVEEIAMIDSLKLKYETVVYDGKYKRPSLTITDAEGAKLIKGEDYLLELPEKDECINAGTYTYKVTFIGNYEGEATLTYKVVPGKASKIVSKGTKQTYIDLKWSTVKGADGYRIYVKTSSGGWKKLATVKGKTTYRVKDLKAGTNYTFAVKAFSKSADGETTIWATEFAEQAFKTLPGKTSKLTAKTSKNAVKLTWKEVKGAEGYRVYVKTAKGGWKTVATVKGGKVTYTVKGLKANTTYEYAVKAFYKDGSATVWSNQFTTVKAKTAK